MITAAAFGPASAQVMLDDSVANVGEQKAEAAMAAVMSKLKDPM